MKKLLIAAAIVCAAVASQAATANWATDWVYSAGTSRDTYNDGGMGGYYWVVLSDAIATTADIKVMTDGTLSLAETGYSLLTDKTAITKDNPKSAVDGLAVANNGKYLTLVIYDDVDQFYGIDSKVLTGAIEDPPTDFNTVKFTNDGEGYMKADTAAVAVPEPTSGLLLLLGVAGLALKRRRA